MNIAERIKELPADDMESTARNMATFILESMDNGETGVLYYFDDDSALFISDSGFVKIF